MEIAHALSVSHDAFAKNQFRYANNKDKVL